MAVVPMPLVPPWTSTRSPDTSRPRSKRFVHTVKKVSGTAAASVGESAAGAGRICSTGTAQYSAYPPPATSAQTESPSRHRPDARTTVPDTSRPGRSDAPGGGGYFPSRCMISGRFTPAAATRISASAGPGSGRGRRTGRRTSGPPGCAIAIASIVGGSVLMSIDCGIGRRQIVPRQPAAQSVEIGEEHAFVDVGLIQLVANFPFERRRDDDTTAEVRVALQPVVHGRRRTRHQREQRELIQDASIDRRRLEKHQKGRSEEHTSE